MPKRMDPPEEAMKGGPFFTDFFYAFYYFDVALQLMVHCLVLHYNQFLCLGQKQRSCQE